MFWMMHLFPDTMIEVSDVIQMLLSMWLREVVTEVV